MTTPFLPQEPGAQGQQKRGNSSVPGRENEQNTTLVNVTIVMRITTHWVCSTGTYLRKASFTLYARYDMVCVLSPSPRVASPPTEFPIKVR